jgi:hypothetical protein
MADHDFKMTLRDPQPFFDVKEELEQQSWSTACEKDDLLNLDWKALVEQKEAFSTL